LNAAIAAGCTAFVTGEMRHHDVLAAVAQGCDIILARHTNTERPYLPRLKRNLATELGRSVKIEIAKSDRDPLVMA
jgi:putative NIF3 family GTP cyclohydrolase 1 type 2